MKGLLTYCLSGEMLDPGFREICPNTTMCHLVGRPNNQHAVLREGDGLSQPQHQGLHLKNRKIHRKTRIGMNVETHSLAHKIGLIPDTQNITSCW